VHLRAAEQDRISGDLGEVQRPGMRKRVVREKKMAMISHER
jgi:hypothetical protein